MKRNIILMIMMLMPGIFHPGMAQRGIILDASNGSVLDPNDDGFVSATSGGFSNDGYYVDEFEITMFGVPFFEDGDALNDNMNGAPCGTTDLSTDTTGFSVYAALDDNDNLIFRFRLTGDRPSVEGYSILLDTDQKMGAEDPNSTTENPGFEIDITLIKGRGKGVYVYNIDGIDKCPKRDLFYPFNSHFQKSIAGIESCGDEDYFYDFYVPFADLASTYGLSLADEVRIFAVTNVSATCAMGGAISDVGGVDDDDFSGCVECAFLSLAETQCPSSLGNLCSTCIGFNYGFTEKPVIDTPIKAYQNFISGTSEPFAEIYVDIYMDPTTLEDQDTVSADVDGNWVSFVEGSLHPDDSITVVARVIGECASDATGTDIAFAIVVNNNPPELDISNVSLIYTENDPPLPVAGSLLVSDPDDSVLTGAVVRILDNFHPDEDSLVYADQSGITGDYDPVTGELTLTGVAYLSDYQAALRSVAYYNRSEDPVQDTREVIVSARDTIEYGDTLSISIEVIPVNDPPVLTGTGVALPYEDGDGTRVIDPAIVVSDLDDAELMGAKVWVSHNFQASEDMINFIDQLGISGTYDAASGIIIMNGNATLEEYAEALSSITYTNNESIPVTLTRKISFQVYDGEDSSNVHSRSIDFTSFNSPPEIIDDDGNPLDTLYESTDEDTPLDICLSVFDPDGDEVFISEGISMTGNGMVNLDSLHDLCFEYVPDPDYNGADTLQIIVCDDATPSSCDTLIVVVEVIPVNDPPQVYQNNIPVDTLYFTTPEDIPLEVCLDVRDKENDPILITEIVSSTDHGTYTIGDNGPLCLIYNPEPDFFGDEWSNMLICENMENGLCDTVVMHIEVLPVNDPPQIVDASLIPTDTFYLELSDNVIAEPICINAIDPEQDLVSLTEVSSITGHGTAELNPGEALCFIFSAEENFAGEERLQVFACDDGTPSLCDSAVIVITIIEENDPPQTYVNDRPLDTLHLSTPEDTPIEICLDIRDEEQDPVRLEEIVSDTERGSYDEGSLNDFCFTFIPLPDYFGFERASIFLCENTEDGQCDTLILEIDILPVNDAPVIINDAGVETDTFYARITVNEPLDQEVLAVDVDDDILELTSADAALVGAQVEITDPVELHFIYMPPLDFTGIDTVSVEVCDQGDHVLCDSASWVIEVSPVNIPPEVIVDDIPADTIFLTTEEDVALDFCLEARDENGDKIRLTGIEAIEPNGSLEPTGIALCMTYTPTPDFFGKSTWKAAVCDDGFPEQCDTVVIWIDVIPVNDPPVAVDDTLKVFRSQKGKGNVLENDYDPEGDELIIETNPESGPAHGTLELLPDGSFEYQAETSFQEGIDEFLYTVCDNGEPTACSTGRVVILVEDVPLIVYQAVSPNGDGLNDYLRIEGIEYFPDNSVRIYDRFNNLVFDEIGYNNDSRVWYGQSNKGLGKIDVPEDTYFYVISLGDGEVLLKGYIVLKRE